MCDAVARADLVTITARCPHRDGPWRSRGTFARLASLHFQLSNEIERPTCTLALSTTRRIVLEFSAWTSPRAGPQARKPTLVESAKIIFYRELVFAENRRS